MIKYLTKFTSKRGYAESLLDGKLFMRPASYYHSLELGQGDMREAAIVEGSCFYKNSNWPIYCMYAINDFDIKNGKITISERCIKDFQCETGYMVLIDFEMFEPMLSTVKTNGYELDAGKVNYHRLTLEDSKKLLCEESPQNLFIKHPYFSYQNEYRIVVTKEVYKIGEPVIDHVEYSFTSSLDKTASIIDISQLDKQDGNYVFNAIC